VSEGSFNRETYLRLIEVAGDRRDEAVRCAEAGAWIAATVMIGAAIEGVLLVTAANAERHLRERGLWPKGDPLSWNLGDLVRLGAAAGWFEAEDFNTPDSSLSEVVDSIRVLRNVLHPGAYVRDLGPEDEIAEEVYQAMFTVLGAVFEVSLVAVEAVVDAPAEGA